MIKCSWINTFFSHKHASLRNFPEINGTENSGSVWLCGAICQSNETQRVAGCLLDSSWKERNEQQTEQLSKCVIVEMFCWRIESLEKPSRSRNVALKMWRKFFIKNKKYYIIQASQWTNITLSKCPTEERSHKIYFTLKKCHVEEL